MKALIFLGIFFIGLANVRCHLKKAKTPTQIAQERADSLFYAHPVYQDYGLPPNNLSEISEAAELMGFTYQDVGGCVVDSETATSVTSNNEKAEPILIKKFGENWKEILFKKADSLYVINTAAINLAKENPVVSRINKLFVGELKFKVEHSPDKNFQLVNGYNIQPNFSETKRRYVFKSRVRASVDLTKKTVFKIDTTTIILDTISLN